MNFPQKKNVPDTKLLIIALIKAYPTENCKLKNCMKTRVSEPEPPGAGVFGWSRRRHFGPAPAPAPARTIRSQLKKMPT